MNKDMKQGLILIPIITIGFLIYFQLLVSINFMQFREGKNSIINESGNNIVINNIDIKFN